MYVNRYVGGINNDGCVGGINSDSSNKSANVRSNNTANVRTNDTANIRLIKLVQYYNCTMCCWFMYKRKCDYLYDEYDYDA